ncbi:MAG: FAD-binding oxidoreductase [Deltaproteobacteria bacterium]|nr:MAG: FAD-binding oxidoreductase [Deltaproteobacteria bacterium]
MSLRDDLAASGATVVEEAQGGYRVSPPSIASLGRAVAVVRAWKLPLRVRGSADAPVHPPPKGVLLDLGSLDRIASVDGVTGIARVEAGCSVAALEAAARRAGSTLGPLLPSVRAGSVGAWLAGPTRGERGIPGARRETAALSVAAVLADGHIAESRAAPRSATGPDLDHLALGGGGRLCVVAAAWIRLFPVAPALAGSWACRDLAMAVAGLERLCHDRVAPARARIVAGADSTRLAAAWEGLETAPMDRDRASRILGTLGISPDGDHGANRWVREPPSGHPVEVDARWASLRGWSQQGELQLLGLHAGGAFATLILPEAGGAEECAALARAAGARVIAPRRMRDPGPAWDAMGAGAVWKRLIEALGVEEAPAP